MPSPFCRGTWFKNETKGESVNLRVEIHHHHHIFNPRNRAWGNIAFTLHIHVLSCIYIRSTQFLLTFLLSYVRVIPMGRLNLPFLHLSITSLLYCTFEEDRALHTCVTSQGNFYSPASSHRNIVIWQPRVISYVVVCRRGSVMSLIIRVVLVIANFNRNSRISLVSIWSRVTQQTPFSVENLNSYKKIYAIF